MTQPNGEGFGITQEEFAALPEAEQRAKFIELAQSTGVDKQSAENVWTIIHDITPGIEVGNVEVGGMQLGDGSLRVRREYDTQLADVGLDGHVSVEVLTAIGAFEFTVPKDQLAAALAVEVPYVSPKKAQDQS